MPKLVVCMCKGQVRRREVGSGGADSVIKGGAYATEVKGVGCSIVHNCSNVKDCRYMQTVGT